MHTQRAYPAVTVTDKAEESVLRGHPWIYGEEVLEGTGESGGLVDAVSRRGR